MTADNFDRIVVAHLDRKPFQMFTIALKSGEQFEVDHPRSVVIRDGYAIFIGPGGKPNWFDHESVSVIAGIAVDAAA